MSGQCVPRTSAYLASRCNRKTVLSRLDESQYRSKRAHPSQKRGVPAILRRARLYTEATIRRALNDGGAMCIEKELRDSTRDMYNDNFNGAGMCPDPKIRKANGPYASFALFARRRAFGTSLPFAITIVPRCRYLSTTLILASHCGTGMLRLPSSRRHLSTMSRPLFSFHLNKTLRLPRAPIDLKLEKLERRRQHRR